MVCHRVAGVFLWVFVSSIILIQDMSITPSANLMCFIFISVWVNLQLQLHRTKNQLADNKNIACYNDHKMSEKADKKTTQNTLP